VPPYRIITYSTPPIPSVGTGIPHGPVLDFYFNKFSAPDRVPWAGPRRSPINSYEECLAFIREDLKKSMRETFGVEMSSKSCVYKNRILHILIQFHTPLVDAYQFLLSSMGRIAGLHANMNRSMIILEGLETPKTNVLI
jgi:hypothetical protein